MMNAIVVIVVAIAAAVVGEIGSPKNKYEGEKKTKINPQRVFMAFLVALFMRKASCHCRCLSVYLYVSRSVRLSICLFVSRSVCLSVCRSVRLLIICANS